MKRNLTRFFTCLGFSFLIVGLFISAFAPSKIYAADMELIGNGTGLEIIPESGKVFDITNLNPGDTAEANITMTNKYINVFELFMRAEQMNSSSPSGDGADLFEQLVLTVYLDNEKIYNGTMMDFATSNISLGKFRYNDTKKLRATICLPGVETGNEFQGKNTDIKWIFVAQLDGPKSGKPKAPILPKTGEILSTIFYGMGICIIGFGIGVGRKNKNS